MNEQDLFRTDFSEASEPETPEELFRSLRNRDSDIRHLWSHQADLLRTYSERYAKASDVAIELPTGAGKTLVGLLIAEWRRQSKTERVVYLCPTRQLANQVVVQAGKYGIRAYGLTGRQRDYPSDQVADYRLGRAIAVTTYSSVLNVNPRLDDAGALILDDAHAGESFLASMWSVELPRGVYPEIYDNLLRLFGDSFDAWVRQDLLDGESESVELLPGTFLRQHAGAIRSLLDEQIPDKTSARYSWNLVRDRLNACNLFVSRNEILIRPLLPPTLTHKPFREATQRIYMSATLGAGGELERLAGVKKIDRIPVPQGWEKGGSGRRLLLLPGLNMSEEEALEVAADTVDAQGRGLVIIPSENDPEGQAVRKLLQGRETDVLNADDIEEDLSAFVDRANSVLVLSRYDGLDLPDEACRYLILAGLPTGTNLQEKFLWSRISAHVLLRDRVLTRFTQGVGRCTRSDSDYALVVIMGSRLVDFLLKKENRLALRPELHAELEFGLKNSRHRTRQGFADLSNAFMEQGAVWQKAEKALVALRQKLTPAEDEVAQRLRSVVGDEIDFSYARWTDDLESALEKARNVADGLGGDETKAYRAWWYYLTADTAMALYETTNDSDHRKLARDMLRRAGTCCLGIRWFAQLARSMSLGEPSTETNELTSMAVETIREKLADWGPVGERFEKQLTRIAGDLSSPDSHKQFHRGLQGLGEVFGFKTELPSTDAAPDCVWFLGTAVYVTHEAKSEQTPDGPIGAKYVRQAVGHENWVVAHHPQEESTRIITLIESPRSEVAQEALPQAEDLCHVAPDELKHLFDEIAAVLRRVRAQLTDLSEEKVLELIYRELDDSSLSPEAVLDRLTRLRVADMKVFGRS